MKRMKRREYRKLVKRNKKKYEEKRKNRIVQVQSLKQAMVSEDKIYCCLCGDEVIGRKAARKEAVYPPKGETKEHIPQKCLFYGYDDEYKTNRITVISCYNCNQEYSEVENHLRDWIGVSNDSDIRQLELTKKAVKSVVGKRSHESRLVKDEDNKVRGVIFDQNPIDKNHIKNVKGIYFEHYRSILPKEYFFKITYLPSQDDTVNTVLYFLESHSSWEKSGHEDIFKYKILRFKNGSSKIEVANSKEESIGIFALLEYHKSKRVLVVGRNKQE